MSKGGLKSIGEIVQAESHPSRRLLRRLRKI